MNAQLADDRSWPRRFIFPAGCAAAAAGCLMLAAHLLASPSGDPVLLGRYSPRLAAAVLILAVIAAASVSAASGGRFSRPVRNASGKIPGWVASLSLFLPAPLLFVAWFAFPAPLLDRWYGIAGLYLLAVSPGVMALGSVSAAGARRMLEGLAMASVSVFAGLVLLEGAARLRMPGNVFDPRFGLTAHQCCSLRIDLPGVSARGLLTTNRWGMRGEEPPDDWDGHTTIIAVGGSTTLDYFLDDSKTWAAVLQERLREADSLVWVGNAGIPDHAASDHVSLMEEVVARVNPDIVVVLVGINDVRRSLGYEAVPEARRAESRRTLFDSSALLRLVRRAKAVYIDGAAAITGTCLGQRNTIEEELSRPLAPGFECFSVDPDTLETALAHYSESIERMIRVCREIGAIPVFLTQPLLYMDDPRWRGISGDLALGTSGCGYSAAAIWLVQDAFNRELLRVCREQGEACFDLASVIPHHRRYFYDMCHFTEAGSRLIGEAVAEFMLSRGLVSGGTSTGAFPRP